MNDELTWIYWMLGSLQKLTGYKTLVIKVGHKFLF